ncbi:DUF4011 domain-containing protein [Listeria sp. SHR_NRA_18]|uniref:DUF4011 domain-containing protein n=1 Tax=Listeria sp. SHR_NRA_18 TaxID=2269046 RepID=UPI00051D3594|nr:DUF4011 domain-containing protein [Listeria sp. SHR_NRA_18]KGL41361.1 hypothetical protein EP56_12335 [Listeriaceae bacterium FSL A5-0209]RQW67290.1 DUF4011 domain-containing protein [Listeria sp. SHR_NRA_18]
MKLAEPVVLEALSIEINYSSKINYGLQQNGVKVIDEIIITNNTAQDLRDIKLSITTDPLFIDVYKQHISLLPSEQDILIRPDIAISAEYLKSQTEGERAQLSVSLSINEEESLSHMYPIDILAYNEWSGINYLPEMTSAFILPNSKYCHEIQSKAATIIGKLKNDAVFDGYQSGNKKYVTYQIQAIYEALKQEEIAYSTPPASFERSTQKIRFPQTIKEYKLGTCLDLTLLMAACIELLGLRPIIVFYKGHANLGVWLKEYCFEDVISDDYASIAKRITEKISDLILIETTYITQKNKSFQEAVDSANQNYTKSNFEVWIDIYRCRISSIKPISIEKLLIQNNEIAEDSDPIVFNIPESDEVVNNNDEFMNHSVEKLEKMELWQRNLLDFTLRNPLLNYNINKKGIVSASTKLAKLEDLIQSGQKIGIVPTPEDIIANRRSTPSEKNEILKSLGDEDLKNSRLRSVLGEGALRKELVKTYRKTKDDLAENGANSLFLAIGFIEWYETTKSETVRYAPLILLPINIVRISVAKGYYIEKYDEEVQVNISLIEYMKRTFSLDLSFLYDLPKDDFGIDVDLVINMVRRKILNIERWNVIEKAAIGNFSFSNFILWNDLVTNKELLLGNKVVKSLIDGKKSFSDEPETMSHINLEEDETSIIYAPLSADSTQLNAVISAVDKKQSFVLHGPPGSGKSQTITNIIAHGLANGQKILFVAAKMAALNVVYQRLKDVGLADYCLEIHSNKSQKKEVLGQFKNIFGENTLVPTNNWEEHMAKIKLSKQELNKVTQLLHEKNHIGFSIFDMINRYSDIDNSIHPIKIDAQFLSSLNKEQHYENIELLKKIDAAASPIAPLVSSPWLFVTDKRYSRELEDSLSSCLIATVEDITQLDICLKAKLGTLGLDIEFKNAESMKNLVDALIRLEEIGYTDLTIIDDTFKEHYDTLKTGLYNGQNAERYRKNILADYDESILTVDLLELKARLKDVDNTWFLPKYFKMKNLKKSIIQHKKEADMLDDKIAGLLEELEQYHDSFTKYTTETNVLSKVFGKDFKTGNEDWGLLNKKLDLLLDVHTNLHDCISKNNPSVGTRTIDRDMKNIIDTLAVNLDQLDSEEAKVQNKILKKYIVNISGNMKILDSLTNSDRYTSEIEWLVSLKQVLETQISKLGTLRNALIFNETRNAKNADVLDFVLSPFLNSDIYNLDLVDTYLKSVYYHLIDLDISSKPELANFSKEKIEDSVKEFIQLDCEYRSMVDDVIKARVNTTIPNIAELAKTDDSVAYLSKAIKSNGRGISIRNLFNKVSSLISQVKPVMLMSPISVAQYLSPDFEQFDLVIFDEASQLPTNEAVGAMARGKNVIIVGDPNQLPPTSFFKAKSEETDFEQMELDSVLDDCLTLHLPESHLEWHYRSEHESLISFSNSRYYDNKLVTFPSVDNQRSRVSFRKVDGVYDRGGTRQNKIEAMAIVDEIFARIRDPYQSKSIGVVTFNQQQQNLIQDIIDERLTASPELEMYFKDDIGEQIFVKNLENVQGDEREVILFSVGYGPDNDGKMTMNFGPLNSSNSGWRRLNVAITRAKKEIVIFASIEPDVIDTSKTKAQGVHDLKSFMMFAKRGKQPLTLMEDRKYGTNNKAILTEIMDFLVMQGYAVETGIGTSSFKIDLAVKSDQNSKEYLCYIALDDENYLANDTVYDREIGTSSILGDLGWKKISVWTIDWWFNKDRAKENLIKQIERITN